MTATALVSGGKDSVFSASLADAQGWEVDELVTVVPADPESMMFHTPNVRWVRLQAEVWGKRYREVRADGTGETAEAEAVRRALEGRGGAVVAGAIQSSYQWSRLSKVTQELGRPLFTPLWGKDPGRVVEAEIEAGIRAVVVHVAAEGLGGGELGRSIDSAWVEELAGRAALGRGVNIAGEGGEYESFVLDAPFFAERIELVRSHSEPHGSAHRLVIDEARRLPKPAT